MGSLAEELTRGFYAWEVRGRGWEVYDRPVVLEPAFRPFLKHYVPPRTYEDDGRRETKLSALARWFVGKQPASPSAQREEVIPEPDPEIFRSRERLLEVTVSLPQGAHVSPEATENLLVSLAVCRLPLAFEVTGRPESMEVGLTCREPDLARVRGLLKAHFPAALLSERPETLTAAWRTLPGCVAAAEFGLAREFMLPLRTFRDFRPDPLLSLYAALSEVREGEIGLFQALFTPTEAPWAESIVSAVHTAQGEPFFADDPDFTKQALVKAAHPLFAVALRAGAKARDEARAWELLRGAASALFLFAGENGLAPLAREEEIDLEDDLLMRVSHRSGMLLSTPELAALVHLPGEGVRLAKLTREARRTKPPPSQTLGPGVLLGENLHEGNRTSVHLPRDLRMRHVHVVGASGSGKSTLLLQMILEDLEEGEGLAVLDPHGDLVDEVLSRFPKEREDDLILFDPADEEIALGWNMLAAHSEIEKTLLASDLVGIFRRLSTSWGDQMNSVLANAILAFLESEKGGTLLELRRFLVDREFRAEFLGTVLDPEVRYYWQREFPLLKGLPQGPILTRLDTFLRPKLVRRVVVEREHRLDFRGIVDRGQVLLAKLSQGAIGEENAALLGSLLVSAFHQAAMSRQDLPPGARRHFFLYLDEFQEVATPSMAALLTGARKYRLGLTLAHQELRQLESKDRDLAAAVLANPATRIVFRVGEDDARKLERGLSSFEAKDLINLGVGEAITRLERADEDFNLRTLPLPRSAFEEAEKRRSALQEIARMRYPRRVEKGEPQEALPARPLDREVQRGLRQHPDPPTVRPKKPPHTEAPPPLGRGGPEHQYLQELIQRWAESKGYRAVIEAEVPGGHVDLALYAGDWSLACEISVTSTAEQEVQNVRKCLAAGFSAAIVVANKKKHLATLRKGVGERLSPAERERFFAFAPEGLFAYLESRIVPVPAETTVGGYRVKVSYRPGEPDERARRANAVAEVLAQSMRRLGKKG